MALSKDQFLEKRPRKVESVDLPAFGGNVFVRKLTVIEQTQYEAELAALDEGDNKGFSAISLAFWLCNEDGSSFLTVQEAHANVGSLEAAEVSLILRAGGRLNRGVVPATVEQIAKN